MTDPHSTFIASKLEEIKNAKIGYEFDDVIRVALTEAIEYGREEGRKEMREKILQLIKSKYQIYPDGQADATRIYNLIASL